MLETVLLLSAVQLVANVTFSLITVQGNYGEEAK